MENHMLEDTQSTFVTPSQNQKKLEMLEITSHTT
jgi:hypothetical protein